MGFGCCTNENMKDEKFIDCTKCKESYHYVCLSVPALNKDSVISSVWECPACVSSAPKNPRQDSTPVRNITTTRGNKRVALTSPPGTAAVTSDDVRTIVQELLKQELSSAVKEISTTMLNIVSGQLEPLKQEMRDFQQSLDFMSARFDDIETEQTEAKRTMSDLQAENAMLKSTITDLDHRINQIEQQSRSNNLEIQCVPENKNENLYTLVHNLAKAVKCDLADSNILHCTRIAKLKKESTRPRSIVVQLASLRIRDYLLAAVISYNKSNKENKLNASHLGFADLKSPVFVVEHLSPANKKLHAGARHAAKEKSYKHVWTKHGRVLVRKTDDSDAIHIKNADSLKSIV